MNQQKTAQVHSHPDHPEESDFEPEPQGEGDEELLPDDMAGAAGPFRPAPRPTGLRLGLTRCHVCGAVCRLPQAGTEEEGPEAVPCERCGFPVHARRPDSLSRTTALMLAATVLYIPANLLPVMHTETLLGAQDDTIMSGVLTLLHTGSWPLAVVVFVASIVVPMIKLLALAMLVVTSAMRVRWAPLQRTRLYRLIERIGRWSMLDVFVITILVGLVQFRTVASVLPGPGALAFAAVVVLTMLASHSFDPRLIWDATDDMEPTRHE